MTESPLNAALKHFEAAEANLVKAEKILKKYMLLSYNAITLHQMFNF